ncbi:hypothetical protein ZIOFF_005973 [Zingiber officinale]|uniref:KOW domain-containing protein n=1 Tax=Zingiber officinale TaxID=94328 RepID=A0A8J5LMZ7_ZINOF|nr:hypothetical protein ZIOFF_005973 [Zingiber officinale]
MSPSRRSPLFLVCEQAIFFFPSRGQHSSDPSPSLEHCGPQPSILFSPSRALTGQASILPCDGMRSVMIIRGKDKGETGIIKRVIRSQNRVIVEGKNLVKKDIKQGQGHEGGIFSIEAPLHVSNVQVLNPVTGKPCKTGYKYLEDGTKVRVSRGLSASGAVIPRPEILKERRKPRPSFVGPKDTPVELVLEKTYDAKAGIGMPDL